MIREARGERRNAGSGKKGKSGGRSGKETAKRPVRVTILRDWYGIGKGAPKDQSDYYYSTLRRGENSTKT